MRLKRSQERFIVGFSSAFAVPLVKVYQNGINVDEFNFMVFVGLSIPVLLMATFIGGYAVIIEKGETDYKRLARLCVSLPALMSTLIGGVNVNDGIVATAHAATPAPIKITCLKSTGLKKGLDMAFQMFTNKEIGKYLVVDRKKKTGSYFLIEKEKWFIQRPTDIKEFGVTLYDRYKCELVKESS